MLHFSKKRAVIVGAIATLAIGGVAFAYFTNSGAGTGSATVGSSAAATVNQTNTLTALFPTTSQPVTVTVTNNGSGSQRITAVQLASITSDKPACDISLNATGSAFTMAPITIGETLAAGATSTPHSGTLTMNDTGANQDSCQGAALTLNYTSS
jgi:hypothetical protein